MLKNIFENFLFSIAYHWPQVLGGVGLVGLIVLASSSSFQTEFDNIVSTTKRNAQSEIINENFKLSAPKTVVLKTGEEMFADVSLKHENYRAINYLGNKDIIQGFKDGYYRPWNRTSRAEFVRSLVVANGIIPNIKTYSYCFPDVTDQWFAPYICYAKSKGWVTGFSDGLFHPSWDIYRSEAVKMLLLALDVREVSSQREQYKDVKRGLWYSQSAATAKILNLVDVERNYKPKYKINRGEAAEMIYRTLVIKERRASRYTSYLGKTFDQKKPLKEILASEPAYDYNQRDRFTTYVPEGFMSSAPKQEKFQMLFPSEESAIQQIRLDKSFEREVLNGFSSTRIKRAEYYTLSGTPYSFLMVNISGREYIHANVPRSVWEEFKKAKSINTFYNESIKGGYQLKLNK